MTEPALRRADFAVPTGVQCFFTTRQGGGSAFPYHSFNLALHVGDEPAAVTGNRHLLLETLQQQCHQPSLQLQWLQQVHGTQVWQVTAEVAEPPPVADALYTTEPNLVLGVLTADCLPVLFCSADGREIAVAHAGWRGLCNGVLEATLQHFRCAPAQVRCWLGPAIGPCHFEVGEEVRTAFLAKATVPARDATGAAFVPGTRAGKWQADLYALARLRLQSAGVMQVSGAVQCTVCQADRYYSYRHQAVTGRFATLIMRSA